MGPSEHIEFDLKNDSDEVVHLTESFPKRWPKMIFVSQVSRYGYFHFVKTLLKGPNKGLRKGPKGRAKQRP